MSMPSLHVTPTRQHGRHRLETTPVWERPLSNAALVATVLTLFVSLFAATTPTAVVVQQDEPDTGVQPVAPPVVHATMQHADGTPHDTPSCLDMLLAPKNVASLVDDEGVLVATLQVPVSPFCGVAFPRLVHVIERPWHGTVFFTIHRAGMAYVRQLKNLFDPLPTNGFALPDGGCIDVSAYIARTEFEATKEATIRCVGLADVR